MSGLLFLPLALPKSVWLSLEHVPFWLGWKLARPSHCPVSVSYSAGVVGTSETLPVLQMLGRELRPSRLNHLCNLCILI